MAWNRLCLVEELQESGALELVVAGRVLAAFQTEEGVQVVDGMCAHQGGPIAQGHLDKTCITCPWHGWQYDLCDGRNLLTNKKMLDVFPAEIRGEEIWVLMPE